MIKRDRGQVIAGAVVLMAVLIIVVGAMVEWIHKEVRWTVKQKRSTTAFHLAEAAVDRGRWKLQENLTHWTTTASGPLTNYNFDKKFTDIEGGTYAIQITSHPTDSGKRIIYGVGRDSTTNEVRKIKAIYKRGSFDAAIWTGGNIDINGASCEINWGPIKAQGNIETNTNRYPRKYARGTITPDPPFCDAPTCTSKSNNIDYWAYYDVPARPFIDFDELKSSAQANGLYFAADQSWNNARPGGSCTGCPVGISTNLAVNKIWYFENDLRVIGSTYIYGTVIVKGELKLNGSGWGTYTITPPTEGYKEYDYFDTAAQSEYYGDAGNDTMSASFTFSDSGATPALKDGIKQAVVIRGFAYGQDEFDASGSQNIHGMIIVDKDDVANSGNVLVFYDPDASNHVPISNGTLELYEWQEIGASWPSGL